MSLFGDIAQVEAPEAILSSLETTSNSVFYVAAAKMHKRGMLTPLTEALVHRGEANDQKEALQLLQVVAATDARATINSGDFGKRSQESVVKAYRRIETMLGTSGRSTRVTDPMVRRFGIWSHLVVPAVMAGHFDVESVVPVESSNVQQPQLFYEFDPFQLPLFDESALSLTASGNAFTKDGRPNSRYLKRIYRHHRELAGIIDNEPRWYRWFAPTSKLRDELESLIYPYFGGHLDKIRVSNDAHAKYLRLLTIMTWTVVLLHSAEMSHHPVFFVEIPVISRDHVITGWRLDAVRVSKIGGEEPSKLQTKRLREAANGKAASIGSLVRHLKSLFGADVELCLLDWKFAVGDGGFSKIITTKDLAKPIRAHHKQVLEYAVLSDIDWQMLTDMKPSDRSIDHSLISSGELVYWLPTAHGPMVQPVATDEEERQACLRELSQRLHRAKSNAATRQQSLAMIRFVSRVVNGHGQQRPLVPVEIQQEELFTQAVSVSPNLGDYLKPYDEL